MLEERINKYFQNLNPTDLHLIEYILQHKDAVSDMTITKLSKNTNISNTTIHRTIKKLGFDGYTEFRYTLKESQAVIPETKELSCEEIQQNFIRGLERTIQGVDEQVLQDFITRLFASKRIYTYATGWRQKKLLSIFINELHGFQVFPIECATIEAFHSHELTADDLVIMISLSGETVEIKPVIQKLHLLNVPIASMTVANVNYLASMATYSFTYYDHYFETGNVEVPWSSRNIYVLLDYLLARISQYISHEEKE